MVSAIFQPNSISFIISRMKTESSALEENTENFTKAKPLALC